MNKNNRGIVSHRLLKGLPDDEAASFEAAYKRASKVLRKINEYATSQANQTAMKTDDPDNFESQNWQHLVAWYGGYRTAMRIMQDVTRTK
jgi:hypothetical protein